ncbi:hypothetical protein ACIFOE_04900 [Paenibacillus sp. NRS-1783]|uniref:hypothetical protein n=1 Tax=Paenibacillus sp. NRS-1783 TaxID=3233907 RepID=UPI003D2D604C
MTKIFYVLLFGMMILAFSSDYVLVRYSYYTAGEAIDHGIDAGIIKAGIITDAQEGYVQLEERSLRQAVRSAFRDNMKMDDNLEKPFMHNTTFDLKLIYDSNNVPWIEVTFLTHVSFVIHGVEYPVYVHRKIAYESIYK